jgi:hypothetical protein
VALLKSPIAATNLLTRPPHEFLGLRLGSLLVFRTNRTAYAPCPIALAPRFDSTISSLSGPNRRLECGGWNSPDHSSCLARPRTNFPLGHDIIVRGFAMRSRFRRREVAAILTMGMTAGLFAAQLARQWTPGMRKR